MHSRFNVTGTVMEWDDKVCGISPQINKYKLLFIYQHA